MKKIKTAAIMLVMSLLAMTVISCANTSAKIDPGSISSENVYTNDFFNVEMKLPDGFYICSDDEIAQIFSVSSELFTADKKSFDYSTEQILPFFYVMEKNSSDAEIAASLTGINMNIIAQSEKLSLISTLSVKNETDYLTYSKTQIQNSLDEGISYTFGDIESVNIGGKTFYKVDAVGDYYGAATVDQILYCYMQDNYVLLLTVTYDPAEDNQVKILDDFLANIKFK